jgi:ABC-type molybdenum transport system ATPase subunit/photorepair protein PhrA
MTENQQDAPLIVMRRCAVLRKGEAVLRGIDWTYRTGESWLITGGNGSGTEHFVRALAGELEVAHGDGGGYENAFSGNAECVSLERAAALIEEERARDESDFTGGADAGRTCRRYLAASGVAGDSADNDAARERLLARMETLPEVTLFGIARVLDQGLKYLSTGEIRRTLLCRALLSGKRLLVLAEPFAGLDAESRRAVRGFLDGTARRRAIVLAAERYDGVPDSVNRVLEFSRGEVSFCGSRNDYEAALRLRGGDSREASRAAFRRSISALAAERLVQSGSVRQSKTADFAANRRLTAGFPEETRTIEVRHSGENHKGKSGESQGFGVQRTGNALCEPEAAPFAPVQGVAARPCKECPHRRGDPLRRIRFANPRRRHKSERRAERRLSCGRTRVARSGRRRFPPRRGCRPAGRDEAGERRVGWQAGAGGL